MKANKAPEKIYAYIPDDDIVGTASVKKGVPHQFVTIEYTRTDAFIEKACDWLTKHAKKYYFNKERYLGTEELVEDFKISMEM